MAASLNTWWRAQSKFTRHFVINVAIGICLTALLRTPWVERNSTVEATRDAVISWQMKQLVGVEQGAGLAWINVDDEAYRDWGVPLMTRRDKLASLIAFAAKGKPRVILVDIDLTNPTKAYPQYDGVLRQYLQNYPRICAKPCPNILLVRTFTRSFAYAYVGSSGPAKQAQPSFLDASLGTAASDPWRSDGPILWGSAEFDREQNGVALRWRLWEAGCDAPGRSSVVPSVVLLGVALERGVTLPQLRAALEPHAATCVAGSEASQAPQPERREGSTTLNIGYPLTLTEDTLQRRIAYRIPWTGGEGAGRTPTLAEVLRAGPIANNPSAVPTFLEGQIVAIGGSFRDGGDLHPTPLGEMPGSLILINELNSLLQGELLRPVNWLGATLIETFLILVISALFAVLKPAWASAASLGIVILGSMTVGFIAFRSGVWVDNVVPLVGVLCHEIIARTHDRTAKLGAQIVVALKRAFRQSEG